MLISKLKFILNYLFNYSNIFLFILILITFFKCFLDFNTTFNINKDNIFFNSEITITEIKYLNFGQKEYQIFYNNQYFISTSKTKINLVHSKSYLADIKINYFSYLNTENFDNNNYNLAKNIIGIIEILNVNQENLNCNLYCQLLTIKNHTFLYFNQVSKKNICDNVFTFTKELIENNCIDFVSLNLSLLFGDTNTFSKTFKDKIQDLSLSHIIAISGFQVVILVSFIEYFFSKFQSNKKFFVILIGIALFILIFLVGPQPPVLRSAISVYISIFVINILKRKPGKYRMLFLSSLVLLWINSFYLINLSFQLSFLASFGLTFIPKINLKHFSQIIYETISSTIFSFIFTLPIIVSLNNGVYLTGLVLNIIIVPFVPIVFFISILSLIPYLGEFFSILLIVFEKGFFDLINLGNSYNIKINFQNFNSVDKIFYLILLTLIMTIINTHLKYINLKKLFQNDIYSK